MPQLKSFSYYDYFTPVNLIYQNTDGNNLKFELTEKTKKNINYDNLSVDDKLILMNYHTHNLKIDGDNADLIEDIDKTLVYGFVIPVGNYVVSVKKAIFRMYRCLDYIEPTFKTQKAFYKDSNIESYLVRLNCRKKVYEATIADLDGDGKNFKVLSARDYSDSIIIIVRALVINPVAKHFLAIRYDKTHSDTSL